MTSTSSYEQFCPVAMAGEILCRRWTVLILRELLCGSTRFNDLRRGLPRMSPALLSKRLKELEDHGLVRREAGESGAAPHYRLTGAGRDTWPIVEALGIWGQRWVETNATLKNLDPSLLMWDIRRNLRPTPLPEGRTVIQFVYRDLHPQKKNHWLIVEDGAVDVCYIDPGFDVDLYVETDLKTMTKIWMGLETIETAQQDGRLDLIGNTALSQMIEQWLGFSVFAKEKKRVA